MNKREAKRVARIYASEFIRNAMERGLVGEANDIPEEDIERIEDALHEIIDSLENIKEVQSNHR